MKQNLIKTSQTVCDDLGWKYAGWRCDPVIEKTIKKFYYNEFRINKDAHAYLCELGVSCT